MKIPEEFFDIAFGKSVAFGYRTEDVDEFVTKAIQIIKELNEENEDLQKKMEVLAGAKTPAWWWTEGIPVPTPRRSSPPCPRTCPRSAGLP